MRSSDRSRGGRAGREHSRSARPNRERPDHRRTALANEAARIMQEHGITDFRDAKAKAAERLGLGRGAPLPDNEEIQAALAERQRIFHGDSQPQTVLSMRRAALALMQELASHEPRIAGDVLSGLATGHAGVDLHLVSDSPEAVAMTLSDLGISHRAVERRHRIRPDSAESFPGFRFEHAGWDFRVTVFPQRLRGHSPISPVDGRPMRRVGIKEFAALLDAPPG